MRYAQSGSAQVEPSPAGGHNWQPMAYSPKEGLVYIPAIRMQLAFGENKDFKFVQGALNTAISVLPQKAGTPAPMGELVAWDPVAGEARWRVPVTQYWRGGVLATSGDLVFQPVGHEIVAYDAATGRALWHYDIGAGAIAAASSYEVDGDQYVSLMVGFGGGVAVGNDQPRRQGRLLVFKLDGHEQLDPYPEAAKVGLLDLTNAVPSKGVKDRGAAVFDRFCVSCHAGGAFLPDLKRSATMLDPNGFKAIVLDGALKANGMASFRRFLDDVSVEDVRAYLLDEARGSASAGEPQPVHAH